MNMPPTPPLVRPRWPVLGSLLGSLLVALLLSGCAAQQAYREAQSQMRQGNLPEALAYLEQAAALDPQSPVYRGAVVRERERLAAAQLERADQAAVRGDDDAARRSYQEALATRPGLDRAINGLQGLDKQLRWKDLLARADAAMTRKDWTAARGHLQVVLAESPRQPAARRALQRLETESTPPPPEKALSAAFRKPLSIEFKEATLRTVFEVIARTAGLNFVFDKDVRTDQRTSIFLRDSTVEAAMRLVLLTNQLEHRVLDGSSVLIYPATAAKQRDYLALSVKSFYLANAEAKNVANTVKTLLKLRDVVVDDKLNLMIVRDTPDAIRLVEKLVAMHDVPDPEVMLEVEILEVKRTRLQSLGINWPGQLSLSPLASSSTAGLTVADLRGLTSNTLGVKIDPLAINANRVDGDANILANPRIRVRNRDKARIQIGERVPSVTTTATSTGFISESVTYVDVGLKLEVEPTIYLDDEVTIKISMEVSNIVGKDKTTAGTTTYNIGQRTASTVLRLRDGENQVLAGLISNEDRSTANKVPGLGEIPIAGRLFGSQADDDSRTEIVLSITPRIVRNIERPSAELQEFDSGTETSLRGRLEGAAANLSPVPGARPAPLATPPARPAAAPATSPAGSNAQTSGGTVAPSSSAATGVSALRFQGPTQARPGESVVVQLMAQTDKPMLSAPMVINFDPAVLQVLGVTEGDFMRRASGQASFNSRIDPTGKVFIETARSEGPALSAPGMLLSLLVQVAATADAPTRLTVTGLAPTTTGGAPLEVAPPAAFTLSIAGGTR